MTEKIGPLMLDSDILKHILMICPHAQLWEDIEGEIQISTGFHIVSSDGHVAPIE